MTARDFLASRSLRMLYLEDDTLEIVRQVEHDVVTPELKQIAARYREITETQIKNLKHVVDLLGGERKIRAREGRGFLGSLGRRENHPITQAMIHEYEAFRRVDPPRSLIELNHALQMFRLQHLENASYLTLIPLAQTLGETEVVRLLDQNRELEAEVARQLQDHLAPLMAHLSAGEQRRAA